MSKLALEIAHSSLTGDRKINQDRCCIQLEGDTAFLVLGDGLGGHPRGEVAAQLLVDSCQYLFEQASKPLGDLHRFIEACIAYAHNTIVRYGSNQHPPIAPRTTAVLALIRDNQALWAHIGDSRMYLLRDGRVASQTQDHSLVQLMKSLPESKRRKPVALRNVVTRCIGGTDHLPPISFSQVHTLKPGDILLACSDGFWGQLELEGHLGEIFRTDSLEETLHHLAVEAEVAGHPHSDNVTAAAIRWQPHVEVPTFDELLSSKDDPDLDEAIQHLQNMISQFKK